MSRRVFSFLDNILMTFSLQKGKVGINPIIPDTRQPQVIAINNQSNKICSYPFSSLFNKRLERYNSNPKPHIRESNNPNDNVMDRILSQYALYGNFIETTTNQRTHVKMPNRDWTILCSPTKINPPVKITH